MTPAVVDLPLRPAERRDIAARRLASLGIAPRGGGGVGSVAESVAETVRRQLAMQAQDLASGVWSIGVRNAASLRDVESAIEARLITRSWPMRGTLHFMATEDVKWMCQLLNGGVAAATRARFAQLEITDVVLDRGRALVTSALVGGRALSRPAALELLRRNGIHPDGQRGLHLLGRYCQEGLLCQGPAAGRQPTFVLLDEWVPTSWEPQREQAMAGLAERYVLSHGPVTIRDFAGWTGQSLTFARAAVALAGDRVVAEEIGGESYLVHPDAPAPVPRSRLHLLPGFDEFLLGYKDRTAMLTAAEEALVVPGRNGVFLPTVVAQGQVVGTWGRRVGARRVEITVTPFGELSASRRRGVDRAATAYGVFLGLPAEVRFAGPRR
ncbi:winged helix DNA-binding domain-containing protein [Lapillicoccus sp.]|uniref:winged helix DNA-binding domain-containing protein n=1 Tax=Lapillicoccus sp. TaxID=1909287 RepID=UPI003983CFA8